MLTPKSTTGGIDVWYGMTHWYADWPRSGTPANPSPARRQLPLGQLGHVGVPFPVGLARVARGEESLVLWAWGVNAYASIVGAVGVIHFGFKHGADGGLALYALAALSVPRAGNIAHRL